MSSLAASSPAFAPDPRGRRVAWGLWAGVLLAAIAHVALFWVLSLAWSASTPPPAVEAKPITVSLVDDVALEAHAPSAPQPPSQSRAPEQGPPADAPPPPRAATVAPDPTPPKPQPLAAEPHRPAPQAAPAPRKPAPQKPEKAKAAPASSTAPASKAVTASKAHGSNPDAKQAKATGSRLDSALRAGLTSNASTARPSQAAPGKPLDAKAAADIVSAIQRQIQPCADRQVIPGPGANQISLTLNLRLDSNGGLSSPPAMVGQPRGVDGDNDIYVRRVLDLGIAAFRGCSPLKLPPEYYRTAAGGWENINFTWQLKH